MRPTKLTMTAFGSYGAKTEVDFEAITGGLYLIVGKTGAGKTTIFDAISFALFGEPSGSERKAAMLHSDYVPLSEDTVVTLEFTHQGRAYRVERRLHFRKKRGEEGYGPAVPDASMTESGETAIQGAQRVTARCEELLGLTAPQFKSIVMLAQGEFREFLRSNSDGKNEILGRLFDNSEYLRYQSLFKTAKDMLRRQREARETEIRTVLQTSFVLPEGAAEEDFLPGHPRLTENLRALAEADEAALRRLLAEQNRRQAAVEESARREAAALADNERLAELEAKRAELAALLAREPEIAVRRAEYAAAEKALRRVLPKAEACARGRDALARSRKDEQTLQARLDTERAALARLRAEAEADEAARAEALQLGTQAAQLEKTLPLCDELREKTAREAALLTEREADAERAEALQKRRSALQETLREALEACAALEGCEAEAARLEGACAAARERREAVCGPEEGLAAQVGAALREAGNLDAERHTLAVLAEDAAAANEAHHRLYQAFVAGQAGLIARAMERELGETGETVCPVCNTRWRSGQAHSFALPAEHVPDKEEVAEAERVWRTREKQRQQKQSALETRAGLLEQRRQDAAARAKKLDAALDGWGALTAPGALEALAARVSAEAEEAEAALKAAQEDCARRGELRAREAKTSDALAALEQDAQALSARQTEREKALHGLRVGIEELERQLPCPDRAAAEEQLDALLSRRDALLSELDARAKALNGAKAACDATEGGLRTLRDAQPELQRALDEAEKALEEVLAQTGFATLADAEAALAPIGGGDGERWLAQRRQALEAHAHALASARERVGELEAQTAGKEKADLDALRGELDAARAALEEATEAASAQSAACRGHRAVLDRVAAAREALAESDGAWQRVSRLANMAVGENAEGGRLSFDRYVMGAIFREVLEMANRRLSVMTGGRFELIHSLDAKRASAAAGLEIEVLDVALGTQRPSGSISGGEGFLVSLALALGLSDVVQNHAGGQKLDTLFIDEGFGSLDEGRLDDVITVLRQLTAGDRLVGVISHVDKLEVSIPQKLRVAVGPKGSTIVPELS